MPLELLLLASLAAAPAREAPRPVASAIVQVSVRIVSGARVRLGRSANAPGHVVRPSVIRLEDGSRRAARLVEFE